MSRFFLLIISLLLFPLGVSSVFALVDTITTDQSLYNEGDLVIISGSVSYDPELPPFAVIQILNPTKSDLVSIAQVSVQSDGSFIYDTIRTGGIKWPSDGTYTIKVTYDGSKEKTIEYKKSTTPTPPATQTPPTTTPTPPATPPTTKPPTTTPTPPPTTTTPEPPTTTVPTVQSTFTTLKLSIPNFPALDKSPQYYIDRYNDEPNYQSWFDSQFTLYSINDVVGYKSTPLTNFPALDKSPQYYLDRYDNRYGNDPDFKSWFDSQFPNDSIYNILGYKDPVSIPSWIKDDAKSWASGKIDDSKFASDIEFMLEHDIIIAPNVPISGNVVVNDLPNWLRNTAHWWSQDLISDDEFKNSLKYLFREKIVTVN